jgi:hypothetical protein
MKTKFNLVGDTFTHLTGGNLGYATHGKTSKYIEWVQDCSGEGTFYVDEAVNGSVRYNDERSYAWLLESKWISGATQRVKEDPGYYAQCYDLIFTHDKELIEYDPEKYVFVPAQGSWIKDPQIYPKDKRISMITSSKDWTEGHRKRLEWVNRIYKEVPIFGRGFAEVEFKEEALCDYAFSVVIENGQYETYFTEKILDCFLTGTVPIYLGAPDIGDYFNMDGIILLNDEVNFAALDVNLYESKREAIIDNYERALKMEVLEDFIYENYLS